jgi:hypothetical protein
MKVQNITLGLVLTLALFSCKKESTDQSVAVNTETQQKLQQWLKSQNKSTGTASLPALGTNKPEWQQTKYAANTYIAPIQLSGSKMALKYFVAKADEDGNIKNGGYYVILSKTATKPIEAENIILENTASTNFTGSVLEYDMNNKLIKALHYAGGKLSTTEKDNIFYKPSTKKDDRNANVNRADECAEQEQFCIDWYWQTFENGILVEEQYLYTTCYCQNSGGGGTGGGSSEEQIAAGILSQALFVTESNVLHSCHTEFETAETKRIVFYWQCVSHPTYKIFSTDKGDLVRAGNNSATGLWKYSTDTGLQHVSSSLEGGSLGATVSQTSEEVDVIYTAQRKEAKMILEVRITASTTVAGKPYESYTTLHPNRILSANNSPYVLAGY